MAKTKAKELKLTDDPLVNIYMMIPLLNDKAREALSYMMYGCFIGNKLAETKEELEK